MNWDTSNDLRSNTPFAPDLKDPFNTLAGLNPEIMNAGYIPDNKPSKMVTTVRKIIRNGD